MYPIHNIELIIYSLGIAMSIIYTCKYHDSWLLMYD